MATSSSTIGRSSRRNNIEQDYEGPQRGRSSSQSNVDLDYEGPSRYCQCRIKAPKWTDDNPRASSMVAHVMRSASDIE